jgi:3',5'-cyclic AMP phosphodiesterase CpdA
MKKLILLLATICIPALSTFAQLTFIHLSDPQVSDIPFMDSDTNAQYFRCAIQEFANFTPKPSFVVVSGDVSNVGNLPPDGMFPTLTRYLFPPSQINPGIGDYFIDSARTIPIFFVPGNHEYWTDMVNPPTSNDTLTYYTKYLIPDTDYTITTDLAVVVCLRSGSDSTISGADKKGKGLTDRQCTYLRNTLAANSGKRRIVVMHHPGVNAVGTNSDGTPCTVPITGPDYCSIANNRTTFLNICDSLHVDVVLTGHEHQNVVANRAGKVISENGSDSTRYIQTAAAFNRSYRIVTVDESHVTVSPPLRFCSGTGIGEITRPSGLSVYPNPATDKVTIGCPGHAEIEILNIEGQTLKKVVTRDDDTVMDLSDLPGGIYLVRATTQSGVSVKKLVKQ